MGCILFDDDRFPEVQDHTNSISKKAILDANELTEESTNKRPRTSSMVTLTDADRKLVCTMIDFLEIKENVFHVEKHKCRRACGNVTFYIGAYCEMPENHVGKLTNMFKVSDKMLARVETFNLELDTSTGKRFR